MCDCEIKKKESEEVARHEKQKLRVGIAAALIKHWVKYEQGGLDVPKLKKVFKNGDKSYYLHRIKSLEPKF